MKGKLLLVLLLLPFVLAGCWLISVGYAGIELTVENHTNQELTIFVDGRESLPVKPCSTRRFLPPPARSGGTVRVEAKDSAGKTVYTTEVTPDWSARLPEVFLQVPSREPGECPTPIRKTFALTVENALHQDVVVLVDGVQLGDVKACSTRTFDAVEDTWGNLMELVVHDEDPRTMSVRLYTTIKADYSSGGAAQVFVRIPSQKAGECPTVSP